MSESPSEVKRTSKWRFGRAVGMRNVRRLDALRERLDIIEARTEGVAVAVRHMMGTVGYAWRKYER